MKTKLLVVASLAATLVIAGAPVGAGQASAAAPVNRVKIMAAGDSITEGVDGDYTWRYRFVSELKRQGVANVDMVGPRKLPKGGQRHYLASGWDIDHDATGGTSLRQQVSNIRADVRGARPDILISYLGTNDFLDIPRSNIGMSPAQMLPLYRARMDRVLKDWRSYVANARAEMPDLKIVLGELFTPRVPVEIRDEYNQKLSKLAAELSALQPRVEVAQLAGEVWASSRYLYDTIHPAPTGETLLAQKFAEAAHAVSTGLFPKAIVIQRGFVAWNPPLRPKIRAVKQRVELDWKFTARYSTVKRIRIKFGSTANSKVTVTKFRTVSAASNSTKWTSKKLKPGTYKIQLQGSRGFMNSTWSKVYTVKVKAPKKAS